MIINLYFNFAIDQTTYFRYIPIYGIPQFGLCIYFLGTILTELRILAIIANVSDAVEAPKSAGSAVPTQKSPNQSANFHYYRITSILLLGLLKLLLFYLFAWVDDV